MKGRLHTDAAGLPIFYQPEDIETAEAMAEAVEKTAQLLSHRWHLPTPLGCRLFVLTGWQDFIDQTAPRFLRPFIALTRPLWASRIAQVYDFAGGWMLPWGKRPSVGVKPPRLLERSDTSLGKRLFLPTPDLLEKVKRITCHELTHAFTLHLRLPPWLNEGVAMRAVDHVVGHPTVRPETREFVDADPGVLRAQAYRRTLRAGDDALLQLYASGYWLTRMIDEGTGAELARVLRSRGSRREHSRLAASAFERLPS